MSTFDELFPPRKSAWTADQMPDLSGKVFIVTGGNSGIGKETVKQLLKKGAKAYMASRSKARAEEAISELEATTGGRRAIFLELDLADLASVRRAAQEFVAKETALHALFNSGGVMACPIDMITKDGYDLQFGTNVLGHFYFTKLLLPILQHTSSSYPTGEKARIIDTSGSIYKLYPRINYDTLRDGRARRKLSTTRLYAQSKFGNILVTNELARRYGDNLVAISLHPGVIDTGLQRHMGFVGEFHTKEPLFLIDLQQRTLLRPAWMGAINQLYAGTDPAATAMNGKYLIPWAREGRLTSEAKDQHEAEKLWGWLEAQVELSEKEGPV
ncbi:NAD(P)-binding protein [Auricularia subglabra TFB-10046 SS5]|uniref:NAD(P)-binding protein n=1 Tax=Auricularia subglabra (strain TFB-10046 / SS5) TaxID=717982 RepID=J0DBD9_AURST|nr:NAD(P)-binding protein [Auricularia subglabra TFB-10046 SS5]